MEIQKTDLKAAVVAAGLIQSGVPEGSVVIEATGGSKRNIRPDVSCIEEVSAGSNSNYRMVQSPKDGLYDMLPEGLFHSPALKLSQHNTPLCVEAIKQQRLEERNARQFFLPFEAAINQQYVRMVQLENTLDNYSDRNGLRGLFAPWWPVLELLDQRQSVVFLNVIPVLHEIRDDADNIEIFLGRLFRVAIKIIVQPRSAMVDWHGSHLGNTQLGIDLVTATKVLFPQEEIVIQTGPLTLEEQSLFLPGGHNRVILEKLAELLFPVEKEIVVELMLPGENKNFTLSDNTEPQHSLLGTNTFI